MATLSSRFAFDPGGQGGVGDVVIIVLGELEEMARDVIARRLGPGGMTPAAAAAKQRDDDDDEDPHSRQTLGCAAGCEGDHEVRGQRKHRGEPDPDPDQSQDAERESFE